MKKINKNGFTLIELLAVITILGILMIIAIPGITSAIETARKGVLINTINSYIKTLKMEIVDGEYIFQYDSNTIYAVPIECIALEQGGKNPFGEWMQANDKYFGYVLVQYDNVKMRYTYGFTYKDSFGWAMNPTSEEKLKKNRIKKNLTLTKPPVGKSIYTNLTTSAVWQSSGFDTNSDTKIKILVAAPENLGGDNENTCTLCQKGSNYDEVQSDVYLMTESVTPDSSLATEVAENYTFLGGEYPRKSVESIHTVNNNTVPATAIAAWDVSDLKNGKIMAWITDANTNGLYELYIGGENTIKAPQDLTYLFAYFTNAHTIDLRHLDTSKTEKMGFLFYYNSNMKTVNLTNFNTSNVRNMNQMFMYCGSLENLDLQNFDTKNVTTMKSMFNRCYSITSINVSSFDTSKVTNMEYMFQYCNVIPKLDLRSFDTRKVELMTKMFQYDANLTCIRVGSNWQLAPERENIFRLAGTDTPTTDSCGI